MWSSQLFLPIYSTQRGYAALDGGYKSGGYLIIKVNNKRESTQNINIDNQLKELINKETNRQLNTYSIIFYKRLKKNIQIDEF